MMQGLMHMSKGENLYGGIPFAEIVDYSNIEGWYELIFLQVFLGNKGQDSTEMFRGLVKPLGTQSGEIGVVRASEFPISWVDGKREDIKIQAGSVGLTLGQDREHRVFSMRSYYHDPFIGMPLSDRYANKKIDPSAIVINSRHGDGLSKRGFHF